MEPTKADPPRTLLLWSAAIVVGNLIAVVWHLLLVVKVQPGFPRFAVPLLILVNSVPVAGVVAFAKGFPKLAGSMIVVPLAIALAIGVYAHISQSGHGQYISHAARKLEAPISDQRRAAGASGGTWLLCRAASVSAHVRAACVADMRTPGFVIVNAPRTHSVLEVVDGALLSKSYPPATVTLGTNG